MQIRRTKFNLTKFQEFRGLISKMSMRITQGFGESSRLTHSTGSSRLIFQTNAVMKCHGTSDMLIEKTLSDSAPPWRWIEAGLNVVGKCWTNGCEACGKRAYMKVGFGSINLTELVVVCPMCHRRMTAEIQPKFCQCYYRLSGLDENGKYLSTEWFKSGEKLQEFRDEGSAGEVARMIVVDCRRLNEPPEIADREAEQVDVKDEPVEIHSTNGWGIDSGYWGHSGCSVMRQYERRGGAAVSESSWGRSSVRSPASVWGRDCVPTLCGTQVDAGWGRPIQESSQECQCQGIQIQIQRREDWGCSRGIQGQAQGMQGQEQDQDRGEWSASAGWARLL
jgi:hypothetical protein